MLIVAFQKLDSLFEKKLQIETAITLHAAPLGERKDCSDKWQTLITVRRGGRGEPRVIGSDIPFELLKFVINFRRLHVNLCSFLFEFDFQNMARMTFMARWLAGCSNPHRNNIVTLFRDKFVLLCRDSNCVTYISVFAVGLKVVLLLDLRRFNYTFSVGV